MAVRLLRLLLLAALVEAAAVAWWLLRAASRWREWDECDDPECCPDTAQPLSGRPGGSCVPLSEPETGTWDPHLERAAEGRT